MFKRIHVIDPDSRRRAQIAHELNARGMHAEIYENLSELSQAKPNDGYIFAVDDDASSLEDIVATLQGFGIGMPIVAYREDPSPEGIVRAIVGGAFDYLKWPFDPKLLTGVLYRLFGEGERKIQQEQAKAAATFKVAQLTPRERSVLIELMNGLANKQIARKLEISPRTVEIHRSNMMRKLNARSISDAVRIGLWIGLDEHFQYAA